MFDSSKSYCAWVVVTYSSSLDTDDSIGNVCTYAEPSYSWTDTVVVAILATILVAIIDVPISMLFDLLASPTKIISKELMSLLAADAELDVDTKAPMDIFGSSGRGGESDSLHQARSSKVVVEDALLHLREVAVSYRFISSTTAMLMDDDAIRHRQRVLSSAALTELVQELVAMQEPDTGQMALSPASGDTLGSSGVIGAVSAGSSGANMSKLDATVAAAAKGLGTRHEMKVNLLKLTNKLQTAIEEHRYGDCEEIQGYIDNIEARLRALPSSTDIKLKIACLEDELRDLMSRKCDSTADTVRLALTKLRSQLEAVQRWEKQELENERSYGGKLTGRDRSLNCLLDDMTLLLNDLGTADLEVCHDFLQAWNYSVALSDEQLLEEGAGAGTDVPWSSRQGTAHSQTDRNVPPVELEEIDPEKMTSADVAHEIEVQKKELQEVQRRVQDAPENGELQTQCAELAQFIEELHGELERVVLEEAEAEEMADAKAGAVVWGESEEEEKKQRALALRAGLGRANFVFKDMCEKNRAFNREVLSAELQAVEAQAELCERKLETATANHIGAAILQEFIADLVGRRSSAARVFMAKVRTDFKESVLVSREAKRWVIALLLLMNLACLAFVLYFGHNHVATWQQQFTFACAFQLATEILLFETMSVTWCHVLVPQLVLGDISEAYDILCDIVTNIQKNHIAASSFAVPTDDRSGAKRFNMPNYFFVSQALASRRPDCVESLIVSRYKCFYPTPALYKVLRGSFETRGAFTVLGEWAHALYSLPLRCVAVTPMRAQQFIICVLQPFVYIGVVYALYQGSEQPLFYIPLAVGVGLLLLLMYRVIQNIHVREDKRRRSVLPTVQQADVEAAKPSPVSRQTSQLSRQSSSEADKLATKALSEAPAAGGKVTLSEEDLQPKPQQQAMQPQKSSLVISSFDEWGASSASPVADKLTATESSPQSPSASDRPVFTISSDSGSDLSEGTKAKRLAKKSKKIEKAAIREAKKEAKMAKLESKLLKLKSARSALLSDNSVASDMDSSLVLEDVSPADRTPLVAPNLRDSDVSPIATGKYVEPAGDPAAAGKNTVSAKSRERSGDRSARSLSRSSTDPRGDDNGSNLADTIIAEARSRAQSRAPSRALSRNSNASTGKGNSESRSVAAAPTIIHQSTEDEDWPASMVRKDQNTKRILDIHAAAAVAPRGPSDPPKFVTTSQLTPSFASKRLEKGQQSKSKKFVYPNPMDEDDDSDVSVRIPERTSNARPAILVMPMPASESFGRSPIRKARSIRGGPKV